MPLINIEKMRKENLKFEGMSWNCLEAKKSPNFGASNFVNRF